VGVSSYSSDSKLFLENQLGSLFFLPYLGRSFLSDELS
jgi:hypothetical protein